MSESLFSNDFKSLKEESIDELFGSIKISISEPMILEDLLIATKAASSKREARDFIKNGAVSINGEKFVDALQLISKENSLYNKYLVLRRGKKNYYLVVLDF